MNEREYHDLHYDKHAERIQGSPLFGRVHARAAREFLSATGAGHKHRVLSLGCGDGSIERRIAPYVGEVVGLDISPVAIHHAAGKAQACGVQNAVFRVWDGARLKGLDLGRFDIVVAFAFLHHLGDAEMRESMLAVRAQLEPGGILYCSDPSRHRLVRAFAGLVLDLYSRYHSPDERELDVQELSSLLVECGFSSPAIRYVDYFLGPLAWVAPGTPRWLGPALETLDNMALHLPFVRRFASSFSLLARVA